MVKSLWIITVSTVSVPVPSLNKLIALETSSSLYKPSQYEHLSIPLYHRVV